MVIILKYQVEEDTYNIRVEIPVAKGRTAKENSQLTDFTRTGLTAIRLKTRKRKGQTASVPAQDRGRLSA